MKGSAIIFKRYTENVAWEVLSSNISVEDDYYPSLDRSFSVMKVTLNLRRKQQFYWMHILIPCLLLNFLGVGIFLFPAGASEKIGFGWGILLTVFVFSILINRNIPKTSDITPVLSK